MSDPGAHVADLYGPCLRKTFKSALAAFIEKEFPQMGGPLVINLFVDKVQSMADDFFPRTEHLRMGQILWFAVAKEEQHGYGKSMSNTKIRPVILTLVNHEDIQKRIEKVPLSKIKERIIARLCDEAYAQGAVLSQTDLSLLLHMIVRSIGLSIRRYQTENNRLLPFRGTVHDMGRTLTHKAQICRKRLLEKKSVLETAQETHHSPQAVQRYEVDLNRVLFCLGKGLTVDQASFVTALSKNLVVEYDGLGKDIKTMKINRGEIDSDGLPF
jgi:hypothetical protein